MVDTSYFIDTSHKYEPTIAKLKKFERLTNKGFILHDIAVPTFGVERAVLAYINSRGYNYISTRNRLGVIIK